MIPEKDIIKTASGLDYLPSGDKLWRTAQTPYCSMYNVMGISLEVSSNSSEIAKLAEELYGNWDRCSPEETQQKKQLKVFLNDIPDSFQPNNHSGAVTRMQRDYLLLSAGSSIGFADKNTGFACAYLTPSMVSSPQWAQIYFLECLGIYLVSRERAITLHAAAVVYRGFCVLLTGHSGAGKSTFAYACLKAGFQLLAEDIVFAAVPDSPLKIWGNPWNIHLMPDTVHFFPELMDRQQIQQLNGEVKYRISVNSIRQDAAISSAKVSGVCSIGRSQNAESRIAAGGPDHIFRALTTFTGDPPINFSLMEKAAQGLLLGNLAHIDVGSDLENAAQMLKHWIETM